MSADMPFDRDLAALREALASLALTMPGDIYSRCAAALAASETWNAFPQVEPWALQHTRGNSGVPSAIGYMIGLLNGTPQEARVAAKELDLLMPRIRLMSVAHD